MDIFDVNILKIHSVKEGKHVVLVDCDTDCWGKTEHNKVCFHKYQWNRIKNKMSYKETEGGDIHSFDYYEQLSDEDYHHRFERSLKEYTDEELAEEVNNRAADNLFHKIKFEVKVIGGKS